MGHFSPPQVVYKKLVSYTSCVGGASASESLNEMGKIAKCIDVKSIIISKLNTRVGGRKDSRAMIEGRICMTDCILDLILFSHF